MEVRVIKLGMLLSGTFDLFEIELEALEPIKDDENVLDAPFSIKVTPEHYLAPLRSVLDGELMFGHIPFVALDGFDLIVSPNRLLVAMQKHGYEIHLTANFTRYLQDSSKPMTEQQRIDAMAKSLSDSLQVDY
ncbi:MAG: hypothetical protein ACRCZA_08475 [Shewanella sp.]|uniref:hypothetical protein n=1 Tax=Shewanella sp. TaxID=50422 RepID=UPI003F3338C5